MIKLFNQSACRRYTAFIPALLALGVSVSMGFFYIHAQAHAPQGSDKSLAQPPKPAVKQSCKDRYILKSKGNPIGQLTIDTQYLDQSKQIVTTVESESFYSRGEEEMTTGSLTRYIESDNLEPQSFHYVYSMGDETASAIEGSVNNATLDVNWSSFSENQHQSALVKPQQFVYPAGKGIEETFRQHFNDVEGQSFQYQTLSLTLKPELVPAQVTLGKKETLTMDGETIETRLFQIDNNTKTEGSHAQVLEWRDVEGRLIKASYPEMKTELTRVNPSMLTPLGVYGQMSYAAPHLDALALTSLATNRIDFPRQTYNARFLITQFDGSALMENIFPPTDRQKVTRDESGNVVIDVAQRLPQNSATPYPVVFDQEYLQSNAFINANDYEIGKLAKNLTKNEDRAYYAAQFIRRWVYQNITEKNYANNFLSAKQVMTSREGDCSEHAVLLAALLRSLGMPARIAVGLVYLPDDAGVGTGKMVYHMWTEVYLGDTRFGEWIALDATQPEDVMDATHIKLMDTTLTSVNDLQSVSQKVTGLIGNLRVKVLAAYNTKKSLVSSDTIQLSGRKTEVKDDAKIDINSLEMKRQKRATIPTYHLGKNTVGLTKDIPSYRFTEALAMLNDGDYQEAVQYLKATSAMLHTPEEHEELGKKLLAAELYNLAYAEFQLAVKESPEKAEDINQWLMHVFPAVKLNPAEEALYLKGVFAEKDYRLDDAWEAFETVYQRNPQFEFTDFHLGNLAMMENQPDLAKQWFQAFLDKRPHDPRAHRSLAKLAMANGDYAQADTYYNQAAMLASQQTLPERVNENTATEDKIEGRLASISKSLEEERKSPENWIALGNVLREKSQAKAALDAYNNALTLSPRHNDALIAKADLLLSKSMLLEAETLYEQHLSKYYNNASGLKVKGLYEMRVRDYPKAVSSLTRAVKLNGQDYEAYDYLSQTYFRMEDLAKGYNKTEEASANRLKGIEALTYAVELSGRQNKLSLFNAYSQKLADYDVAAANRLFNMIEQPIGTETYLKTSGYIAYKLGDLTTAESQLTQYLKRIPEDEAMITVVADIYGERHDIYRAMSFYQKALKLNENYVPAIQHYITLLDTHGLDAKKPEWKEQVTPDEDDYLTNNYLFLLKDKKRQRSLYNTVSPYLDTYDSISVQSIYDAKKASALFAEYTQWLEGEYKEKSKMVPPAYAIKIHDYTLKELYFAIGFFKMLSYESGLVGKPKDHTDKTTIEAKQLNNKSLEYLKMGGQQWTEQAQHKMGFTGAIFTSESLDELIEEVHSLSLGVLAKMHLEEKKGEKSE